MESINRFFANHGSKVIVGLLFLLTVNQCSTNSRVSNLKKEMTQQFEISRIDSKVEGLKGEIRSIQATDRKLWDLERQNVAAKEIEALEAKKIEILTKKQAQVSAPKEK